jgi:ligand-binding sensor domain-containing protein/two-component sensor histidine kinase
MFLIKNAVNILLFLLLPGVLSAQPYNFVTYSLSEGLPQSQVFAALQDSRGYLWFGTQGGGICRFDGQIFETFGEEEGMPSNYVNVVFEDSHHRIWAGTSQGVAAFDGLRFQAIAGKQGSKLPVSAIWEAPGQVLWLGTTNGIYGYDLQQKNLKKLSLAPALDQIGIFAFCPVSASGQQYLWIGTHRGVWIYDQKTGGLSARTGMPANPVYALAQDKRGNVWMASFGDGLSVVDATGRQVFNRLRSGGLDRILCLHTATDGAVWAGTVSTGLAVFKNADSTAVRITEADGLPQSHIRSITSDRNGHIWIGTSGGGVARLSGQSFRHYNREEGLLGSRVYALKEDHTGHIWVASSQNGVQVFDSSGIQPMARDSGRLKGVKCKSIAEDKVGNIWVATEGKGLAVIGAHRIRMLNRENKGFFSNMIQKVVCDPTGAIWVATEAEGIARITPKDSTGFNVKTLGKNEGLPEMTISTMQVDGKGDIWFGTPNGKICRITNGRVDRVLGEEAGLPPGIISSMAFDENGNCWVGFKGDGIYFAPVRENMRFHPVNTPRRMSSKTIYLLLLDRNQNLWAGTENGVDRLLLEKGGTGVTDVVHFGKNEGFVGIETCQDAAISDHMGNLWFGTMNGLERYIPSPYKVESTAPLIHFQEISLFYKPISDTRYASFADFGAGGGLKEGLELPWDQNHLSFSFKGINLDNPQQVRYRWKLEGADTSWSPLSVQNQVNYANLAPGTYKFMVQATTGENLFSSTLTAPFTILKPFWMYWPFQLLVLLLMTGLIALTAWLSVKRFKKAEQARRAQLEVQNRLLQLEQKALQLQMNPHFIFNALNSIQSLISTQEFQTARQEINGFAKLMRSILTNSRQPFITLREEIDTLEQYLKIEQFCQQNAFTFSIRVSEALDPDAVSMPPMLLQPFVENAVIHGISHLQYPGKIELDFELHEDILTCMVSDNGVGREKAAFLRQSRKPGHQSTALAVTRERLEAMCGQKHFKPLEISDVLDPQGSISGTRVVVKMPVELKY